MAMGSGLLALALLAADGPSCPSEESTTFQVKVLTLDGLDWRTSSYSRLQPVARQGTSAIWTADRSLAAMLADRASSVAGGCKVVATGETAISQADSVNYVAAMDRVADGPINQSSALAFMPRPERVDERFAIKLAGRKLDQGTLTRLTLEETHVDALHTVPQTESVHSEPTKVSRNSTELGRDVVKSVVTRTSTETTTSITASVQIPEVSQTRIDGEWLIPKDGVLLISLGVKTVAGDNGKAVVRERVAVVEAVAPDRPSPFNAQPYSKLSMPQTPMRSLPQSVDSNGSVIDLPPLPESVASADLDRIKPEPNQPSPQAPNVPQAGADPSLARTSYDAAPAAPNPPLADASEPPAEAHMARLKKLQEALAKAGFDLDINVDARDPSDITLTKPVCEKCDGDSLFCPSEGKSLAKPEMPGWMKLVGESAGSMGVSVKDAQGIPFLNSVVKLDDALKTPGKTETTVLPLGGQFSLEIKATVVPTPKATARHNGGLGPK
jgi:hypothetical protein